MLTVFRCGRCGKCEAKLPTQCKCGNRTWATVDLVEDDSWRTDLAAVWTVGVLFVFGVGAVHCVRVLVSILIGG